MKQVTKAKASNEATIITSAKTTKEKEREHESFGGKYEVNSSTGKQKYTAMKAFSYNRGGSILIW